MISRDAYLAVEMIVGYFALLFGCMGQAGFASPVIKRILPIWIGAVIVIAPYLIVYSITFFKVTFLSPRAFRFCLGLAIGWFAVVTLGAEVLCLLGFMPPDSPAYAGTLSRGFMHAGWLSVVPLVRLYVDSYR